MTEKKLRRIVEGRVPGLFYLISIFTLIEFAILIVCIALSANQNIVRIFNPEKELIYENTYTRNNISEFKKLYGIENFKEEGFAVVRINIDNKFPTRTWISLAVCVPLVLIFFIVFLVRVFEDVFGGKKPKDKKEDLKKEKETVFEETRFEKVFSTLGRLNIYSLGATVLLAAFFFWMVPDLLISLGRISYETISELKWVILGVVFFGGILLVLRTVFAYKTRKEIIRQQADIQKNRDRLAIASSREEKLLEDKTTLSEE